MISDIPILAVIQNDDLFFHRGSGELRRKMHNIYIYIYIYIYFFFFLHFSFSVATKKVKILLQAREVLNLELTHLYFLSVGEGPFVLIKPSSVSTTRIGNNNRYSHGIYR